METKYERYNRKKISASELADLLAIESRNGWIVVSAENEDDDFVVKFEREND